MFSILFKKDTTFQYCYKCQHWSGYDLNQLKFKKKFRFLRLKYWIFLISKLNFRAWGICYINIIDDENNKNFRTRGCQDCLITSIKENVIDISDIYNKLPDNPDDYDRFLDNLYKAKNDRT